MEQSIVLDGNKFIAEFMDMLPDGYEIQNPHLIPAVTRFNTAMIMEDYIEDGFDIFETYQFHESWDWLMPVVKKIESLGFNSSISFAFGIHECRLKQSSPIAHPFFTYGFSRVNKIDAIYNAITRFIKWYNEKKINDMD